MKLPKIVVDQKMRDILDEVTENMRDLYADVRKNGTDLQTADSMANIAGKILKAQQLILAREMFLNDKAKPLPHGPKSILTEDPQLTA